jgi:hypothetical protein
MTLDLDVYVAIFVAASHFWTLMLVAGRIYMPSGQLANATRPAIRRIRTLSPTWAHMWRYRGPVVPTRYQSVRHSELFGRMWS